MKKILYILIALLGMGTVAHTQNRQTIVDGVSVGEMTMEHDGGYMTVDMKLDLAELAVSGNRAVLLTPRLVNGADSLDLPSVGIYGRRRYYYYLRNGDGMLTGDDEMTYVASEKPDVIAYHNILPYAAWMNGAVLSLHRSDYGCCNTIIAEENGRLGKYAVFSPNWLYVRPQAEAVKVRSLEGSAFIDFPVDKTVIYPDYRRNTVELGKIQATIDSIRGDRDITITQVWLKGFASPEGSYKHNTDLAIGRTAALKKHIGQLYSFADSIVRTEYEPEDWEGLRRYVEKSDIAHRSEILSLINSDMAPDAKEAKIKRTYPEEYRFLLRNCYPELRHTDYRIAYNIRTYSDVAEIIRIMGESPQKLSLNELFLAAGEYEPGNDEWCEVFETAVRMYPDDETANLNAANVAMSRGDLKRAGQYLSKAGDGGEALYARGVLAALSKEYDRAASLFREALNAGITEAEDALRQVTELTNKPK